MIVYAMIVRSTDGLPLSAATDSNDQNSVEIRRTIKSLSKQISQMDDRCSVKMNPHVLHVVTGKGISFMALCEPSYPAVLAFSFLSDLQKEFITKYDAESVKNVLRPYTFIEFDQVIQKVRQRYNNPRSLTTRISLNDLSTELTLRPAQQLNLDDLAPSRLSATAPITFGNTSATLGWQSYVASALSIACTMLCLYRGISILNESTLGVTEGTNPMHGIVFLMEAAGRITQVMHLLHFTRWHTPGIWLALALCVCCNLCVYELQDAWQLFLHNLVTVVTAVVLLLRTGSYKGANYRYMV